MNENFNPYETQANQQPAQPQQRNMQQEYPRQAYPQQSVQQQPVQQPVRQQTYQTPTVQQQGYPQPYQQVKSREEQLAERERLIAQKAKGQAKGFGMVSLIIGCISLIACAMILFNFQISVSDKWYWALESLLFLGLPGGICGAISLAKKPDNKIITVLGLAFAGVMLVCALGIYFYAANTGAHLYWFGQAKR